MSAVTNTKRARYYGYTTTDYNTNEGNTEFSDIELNLACQHVLSETENECQKRINPPSKNSTKVITTPASIDDECNPYTGFLKHISPILYFFTINF